jgi:hypothetical protein
MSKIKFEVGQRVAVKSKSNLKEWNQYERDVTLGVVKSIGEDGKVTVKMDGKWHTPNPDKFDSTNLITEVEANQILDKLEAEFEAWAAPIRDKMTQAGDLLLEANKLAQKQKVDLVEMHELVSPLINAMSKVGWSTSSLSC